MTDNWVAEKRIPLKQLKKANAETVNLEAFLDSFKSGCGGHSVSALKNSHRCKGTPTKHCSQCYPLSLPLTLPLSLPAFPSAHQKKPTAGNKVNLGLGILVSVISRRIHTHVRWEHFIPLAYCFLETVFILIICLVGDLSKTISLWSGF